MKEGILSMFLMDMMKSFFGTVFLCLLFACGSKDESPMSEVYYRLVQIELGGDRTGSYSFGNVKPGAPVSLAFDAPVSRDGVGQNTIRLQDKKTLQYLDWTFDLKNNDSVLVITPLSQQMFSDYALSVWPGLLSAGGLKLASGFTVSISTGMDTTDKFHRIPDEELLTLVQKQTFRYFWDFGHPVSGMARERSTSGNTVTTGGTGFGVMAMLVAVERGFISRSEALDRIHTICDFLYTRCTHYHGAFAHWINGETGQTQAFSQKDNGADLVETSLLFQGLLTARQYFGGTDEKEKALVQLIDTLWQRIDWNWFRKDGGNVLYWHWSPDYGWEMNLPVRGWNECLITYVLAASSPVYPLPKTVYDEGWARGGQMKNGRSFYGYTLPLGADLGGPLFFSQYSFLGLSPKNLKDAYADYWQQNRAHVLINRAYCMDNPKGFPAYGADCWGLTASDGNNGYSAHSPANDRGVIAPTAALSSMPYTPEESMQALRFYYYKLGDKLWGDYGFYDAFNLSAGWFDDQYIAIDQGPVILMIENYRTGLLWNLFMSHPDVRQGLEKLGFSMN